VLLFHHSIHHVRVVEMGIGVRVVSWSEGGNRSSSSSISSNTNPVADEVSLVFALCHVMTVKQEGKIELVELQIPLDTSRARV